MPHPVFLEEYRVRRAFSKFKYHPLGTAGKHPFGTAGKRPFGTAGKHPFGSLRFPPVFACSLGPSKKLYFVSEFPPKTPYLGEKKEVYGIYKVGSLGAALAPVPPVACLRPGSNRVSWRPGGGNPNPRAAQRVFRWFRAPSGGRDFLPNSMKLGVVPRTPGSTLRFP